jgi:hypothetical protein
MIEINNKAGVISVVDSSKAQISLDINSLEVKIDDLNVVHA